jgi:hypothetical protein
MNGAKVNRSRRPLGRGRGIPMRLASAIARKYALSEIVIFTADFSDGVIRQRVVTWGKGEQGALSAARLGEEAAKHAGWPHFKIDVGFVKTLKNRVAHLEREFARIIERDGDPIAIARAAIKAPEEDAVCP